MENVTASFAIHESRQLLLEFDVNVERTVEKARARGACAVLLESGGSRLLDLGVIGEAEVVVGPEHDDSLAVHDDDRILARSYGAKVRVQTRFPNHVRILEIETLVENVHVTPSQQPAFSGGKSAF